ncbi:MAG: glycosyltransferase family 4 protein [Solirubrobacteraceae bacterium]
MLYLSADPGVPVHGAKGASVHVRALVGALHELGHRVTVASPRLEPGDSPLPEGVQTIAIPAVAPKLALDGEALDELKRAQTEALSRLVGATAIDVIYERYSLHGVAGARLARALGVPLLLEVNAPLREEARRFRTLPHPDAAAADEREVLAAAARVFAVSEPLAGWLHTEGVPAERIEVTPNAFPPPSPGEKEPLGPDELAVVGFAGGLKPWHGIATLLAGFRAALDGGARMRLEIAGAGPCGDLLDGLSLAPEHFRWHGHLEHATMLRMLAGWDIGVAPFTALPGFYFSPLKLGEYMAAGLCPVVSDLPPLRAAVEDGRSGVLVAPDDPRALGEALLGLDRDRDRLRRLGASARRHATAGPSWQDTARRVLATV